MVWYYMADDNRIGPVDDSEMGAKINAGVVCRSTPVWHEGLEDWQAAGQTELADKIAAEPPPFTGIKLVAEPPPFTGTRGNTSGKKSAPTAIHTSSRSTSAVTAPQPETKKDDGRPKRPDNIVIRVIGLTTLFGGGFALLFYGNLLWGLLFLGGGVLAVADLKR
jgi:hypothetical protein